MIYGHQKYQPKSNHPGVVAYFYEGTENEIITIVNISPFSQDVIFTMESDQASSTWVDVLTANETFRASGRELRMLIGQGDSLQGLRILRRIDRAAIGAAPASYPVTRFDPTVLSGLVGELLNNWTPYDGNWYSSGTSIISDTPSSGATLTYDQRTGANFTYSGSITILSGSEAGLSFRLGSTFREVFRVEDVKEDYLKGYDVILSRSEGRIKIARRPHEVISSYPLQVLSNSPYRLKVIANGSRDRGFPR